MPIIQLDVIKDRAEWLKLRSKGISATDVSGILGMNPYRTPMDVWWDKVQPVDDDELDNESIEWGNRLEPMVVDKFGHEHPDIAVSSAPPGLVISDELPWVLSTPDRLVSGKLHGGDRGTCNGVLEVKTAGARQAKRWDNDETPDEYVLQVQWQMASMGPMCVVGFIAALIAGQRYTERMIERDDELIELMIRRADDFRRDHIEPREPPIADPFRDAELLAHIYDVKQGATVELDGEARLAYESIPGIKQRIEALKSEEAEAVATVKQFMGENEIALIGNDVAATWKESSPNRFDQKAHKAAKPKCHAEFTSQKPTRTFLPKEINHDD